MKKVLLTLALAAFAFAANAQFVVSGSFGFSTNGGSTWGKNTAAGVTAEATLPTDINTTINFGPSFGYMLSDNMQVGLSLDLGYNYTKEFDAVFPGTGAYTPAFDKAEDWLVTKQFGFGIAPYFRYYFMQAGNFNFFCEAQLGLIINGNPKFHRFATEITGVHPAMDTTYSIAWNGPAVAGTTVKQTMSSGAIAFTITPGVNYKFNDNFSADLYLELLGVEFTHSWVKAKVERSTAAATVSTETRNRDNRFNFFGNFDGQTLNNIMGFRVALNYHF